MISTASAARVAPIKSAGTRVPRSHKAKLIIAALMVSTSICTLGVPSMALAQSAATERSFSIRSQRLSTALLEFSNASGIDIFFDQNAIGNRSTSGLTGRHTVEAGLSRLLSGSGLSWSFTGPNAVTVRNGAAGASAAAPDGSTVLETITVTGQGGGYDGGLTPDSQFQTPGPVAHVSAEQLSRVPPTSPGDMLSGIPGVLNGGNRVGNSLNPNIRGLQGMGRVNTTVDGALNSATSYRGYMGTRDETYVDPDMIGGIDVTKGPSDGVGGSAIGGNIAMRTLNAGDIVRDGENWGMRFKSGIGSNGLTPMDVPPPPYLVTMKRPTDRPSFFNGDNWSGSMAAATLQDNFEGVFAISKRKEGNYFAGSNNTTDGFVFQNGTSQNATVRPGEEIYNTSQDTESVLAKGKFILDDGQSFEFGFMRYDSLAGEEEEILLGQVSNIGQRPLSHTVVDTYTAKYRNKSDNPLIDLRTNLWHTNLDHDRDGTWPNRDYTVATTGGDISNRAVADTSYGIWTFDAGAEFRHEHTEAQAIFEPSNISSPGPSGTRTIASGFGKATFEPVDWLALSAGARLDHYTAEGEGLASVYPDRKQSRVSPNFGAVLKPFDGVQLFAQYKEGFRPPSMRELYWQISTLQVNPDLQGEVSKNWEFGFNVSQDDVLTVGDKVGFKASYFRNRYDDFIIVEGLPGSGLGGRQHFTNIDRANYEGIELAGKYDAGWFFAEGSFSKYLEAEYCRPARGCYTPRLGEILANVTPPTNVPPEWSGTLTAGVRLFDEALTLGGRATFSSTRFGMDWPSAGSGSMIGLDATWPDFAVFDLFGSYKFSEDTMLNFSVENLTDQYYYGPLATTGMPSPGRTARLSFTHRIGGAGFVNIPEIASLGRASVGEPGDDWTGLYVGGHLGLAASDVSGTISTFSGALEDGASYSDNGRVGGAQIGYNHQFGNKWIVGVEGDFTSLNRESTLRTFATETEFLGSVASETEYELDWSASLRGRLGYSFGRLMVYGAGGVSFLQQTGKRTQYRSNGDRSGTEPYFSESDSAIKLGWTLGTGFEYALANNWSLTGGYTYSRHNSMGLQFEQARRGVSRPHRIVVGQECFEGECWDLWENIPGTSPEVEGRKASNDAGTHMFKLGVNYRF